jgi:hypothetical protein
MKITKLKQLLIINLFKNNVMKKMKFLNLLLKDNSDTK